jgi:preprotein translocase subunit SecA
LVKEAGGLLVIGTERHESRRIDDQLRGRAGRQGDNGRTRFFLSMEDDLMRLFGSEKISALLLRLGLKEGEAIVHPWVSKSLERAQQKVEGRNYEIRKNILQYDDVMNDQRYVIYSRRNEILNNTENLAEIFKSLCRSQIIKWVDLFIDDSDVENLDRELYRVFGFVDAVKKYVQENGEINRRNKNLLIEYLNQQMEYEYAYKTKLLGEEESVRVIQNIALMILDYLWKDHQTIAGHQQQARKRQQFQLG